MAVTGKIAREPPQFVMEDPETHHNPVPESNINFFGEAQFIPQGSPKWCYAASAQMIALQNVHENHPQCWYATVAANQGHNQQDMLDCCTLEDKVKHRCKKMGDVSILNKACQVSSTPRDITQDSFDAVYTRLTQEVAANKLVSFGVQAKAGYGHSILGFGHRTLNGKRWVHIYDPEHGGSEVWIEYPSGKPKYARMVDMRVHRRLVMPGAR